MTSSKHISRWYHAIQQWLSTLSGTMDIQTIACPRVSNTISFPSRKACPAAISARGLRARKVPIPPTTAQGKHVWMRARANATGTGASKVNYKTSSGLCAMRGMSGHCGFSDFARLWVFWWLSRAFGFSIHGLLFDLCSSSSCG